MSDTLLPSGDQPPEAQAPPEPSPWAAWEQAGVDPTNEHALSMYDWGKGLWNPDTRAQTVLDAIQQDPALQQQLAQMFTPQQPQMQQPEFQRGSLPPDYNEPMYNPQPQYGQQDPSADYMPRAEVESLILQDRLMRQLEGIAARENLNPVQQGEVFNRAWQHIMAGEVTADAFNQIADKTLQEIRGVWGPPPAPEPDMQTAQQVAAGMQAPGAVSVNTGTVPGGEQPPATWSELGDRLRAQLAVEQNMRQQMS